MTLRTSHEWYQFEKHDIADPDGWPRTTIGMLSWFVVPITEDEFKSRRNRSTGGGSSKKNHLEHSPFGPISENLKKYWGNDPATLTQFCSEHQYHCRACLKPWNSSCSKCSYCDNDIKTVSFFEFEDQISGQACCFKIHG
jgi:hypothetical protein